MTRVKTDERIVVAMTELLRRQGYAATGIKQVVETSGAPIGSIYHHFKGGKRDIAAAALRQSGTAYGELVGMLLAPYDDPADGIEAAFVAAAETIEQGGWLNMCPVGTVAGEIADAEPDLREIAAEVMSSWIDTGAALFTARGLPEADARSLMTAAVSALEGAFIVARTQRSTDAILAAGRAMGCYARALATPARAEPISEAGEVRR
ncbi:putative TetR family transcriptional regulator [Gordonia namibiensis NBRC 108229]|uniref:Putative TetR family transcriptional regulator n=1 Tax=Gordonia namibiensis NBRC 108229 TaxID=1208314 RepID=K6XRM9_9ACTN|nr:MULTISPECIES: TetR/AcrR family transcriptional regulator [Gordonia]MCK8615724.1 TetR/AcrR family transcriptional regulator [Gordonia sp. C13]MDJ0029473.1 TetR/AcrR family transcriptional regulator [Gordonia alkanivorans]GAC01490.1 putative TetR family transcriptional regulator [Gordonia namibiensis NBRC 108229]